MKIHESANVQPARLKRAILHLRPLMPAGAPARPGTNSLKHARQEPTVWEATPTQYVPWRAPPPLQFQRPPTKPTQARPSGWLLRGAGAGRLGAALSFPFLAQKNEPCQPCTGLGCLHFPFPVPTALVAGSPITAAHLKPLKLILRPLIGQRFLTAR
jgi:hypothetical protein